MKSAKQAFFIAISLTIALSCMVGCKEGNISLHSCDEERITELQKEFFDAYSENSTEAKRLGLELIRNTDCPNINDKVKADARFSLSTYYEYHERNYDSAAILLHQSADLQLSAGDSSQHYSQILNLGLLNVKIGNKQDGFAQINDYLTFIQTTQDPLETGFHQGQHVLAKAYMASQMPEEAKVIIFKSLGSKSVQSNPYRAFNLLNDLVSISVETGDCIAIKEVNELLLTIYNDEAMSELVVKANQAQNLVCH